MMLDHGIARSPSFVGAKVGNPIPLSSGFPVDALIQASLDPDVRSIEFVREIKVGDHLLRLDGVVITTTRTGRSLLSVVGTNDSPDLDQIGSHLLALESAGIGLTEIASSQLSSEPRRGDHRIVWSCRHVPVSKAAWRSISAVLGGRSAWTLGDLASRLDVQSPIETIYSLACADRLSMKLNDPLSLHTIVSVLPDGTEFVGSPFMSVGAMP